MTSTLTRRLEKLETVTRATSTARWHAAVEQIRSTMDPEHVQLVADWLRANVDGKRLGPCTGDPDTHVCPRCIDRLHPPALARAVWFVLVNHMTTGDPVTMPPNVAQVYLDDPNAYPANPCEGCGYLLPTRSRIRPDGTYKHIAVYVGICPVCEHDNHSEATTA
jgi:hypothetical protein